MRKITITPTGGGQAVVIGDDSLGRGEGSKCVISLRPRFSANAQRADFVRGAEPTFYDREQEATDISLDVAYCFASYNECDAFLLGLQAAVPRQGTLTMTTTGPGGTQTRTLAGCLCRPIEVVDQVGVTAFVHYQFTGGLLTT